MSAIRVSLLYVGVIIIRTGFEEFLMPDAMFTVLEYLSNYAVRQVFYQLYSRVHIDLEDHDKDKHGEENINTELP